MLNQVSGLRVESALLNQAKQLAKRNASYLRGRLANPDRLETKFGGRVLAYRTQDVRKPRQSFWNHVPCGSIPIGAVCQEIAAAATFRAVDIEHT